MASFLVWHNLTHYLRGVAQSIIHTALGLGGSNAPSFFTDPYLSSTVLQPITMSLLRRLLGDSCWLAAFLGVFARWSIELRNNGDGGGRYFIKINKRLVFYCRNMGIFRRRLGRARAEPDRRTCGINPTDVYSPETLAESGIPSCL
jgi:hypothetical protein